MKTAPDCRVAFEAVEGIVLIPGGVDGTAGYFAFDTGAMETVLNSARVGAGGGAHSDAVTFSGGTRASRVTTKDGAVLSFGGITAELDAPKAIDMSYVEAPLRKARADICFLGSIGADLIGDERFILDCPGRALIFNPTRLPERAAEVPLVSRDPLPVIELTVGDRPLPFVLDTGANHFVIDRAAAPMDALCPVPGQRGVYRIPALRFARAEYRDVTGLVSDLSAMRESLRAEGIIGFQLLRPRVCVFDYPNERLLVV